MECWRGVTHGSVLNLLLLLLLHLELSSLLQLTLLLLLELIEIKIVRRGRGHVCHVGVGGGVEGSIFATDERLVVVEPGWRTHLVVAVRSPICSTLSAMTWTSTTICGVVQASEPAQSLMVRSAKLRRARTIVHARTLFTAMTDDGREEHNDVCHVGTVMTRNAYLRTVGSGPSGRISDEMSVVACSSTATQGTELGSDLWVSTIWGSAGGIGARQTAVSGNCAERDIWWGLRGEGRNAQARHQSCDGSTRVEVSTGGGDCFPIAPGACSFLTKRRYQARFGNESTEGSGGAPTTTE